MHSVFQIVSVVVPVVVFCLCWFGLPCLTKDPKPYKWWLIAACIIFFLSWYLPSPLIEGKDTSFTTHFVGGGVFSGLLWYYLKQVFAWHRRWYIEAISLFALVSALGVLNELFEVVLYMLGDMTTIADTSWDLVANTLGSLVFFVLYSAIHYKKPRQTTHGRRD